MKKKFLLLLALIILTGCNKDEQQKVTLMLDYAPNTNHTGIYVAMDKGYFNENDIDLEIITNSGSSTDQAVSNQVVDFGISYEENLTLAQDNGLTNLKSIYAILKENTSGFISYEEKGIQTPEDFKDKTYCGWGGEVEKAIVEEVALKYGISNDDFQIALTQTDFMRSNKEECDFFWEYEGWAGIEAQRNNLEYNYISLKDLGYDFYSPIIITSDEFIDSDEEIVQGFINATIKGYEYASENPQEAAEIFLKYNPSYEASLIVNSQEYLSKYYIADNNKAGYQEDKVWIEFTDFLYNSEIISTNESKELYTNEYINNYYQS